MSSIKTLKAEDDLPVRGVTTALLHRLRAAALPPKPFTNEDSERAFVKRYQEDGMLAYSIALVIGGIALFGFFLAHAFEGATYGSDRWMPQATRLVVAACLIALAYLLLSKKSWFYTNFSKIGLIGPIVALAGVALLPFTMHASASDPGFPFARFFLSLSTTIWICFAFSRVSRTIILLVSAIASVLLALFGIYHKFPGAYFSSMHLAVAIWAGWALSVLIEKRERQTFISQERMTIESHAMAENIERADLINEMQSDALQTIAHDIRQPLLSLGLYADIVSSKYSDMPNVKDLADKITACLKASESSIIIVENVLQSANEASQFNISETDLSRVFTMLDVVFTPTLAAKGIRLQLPGAHQQQVRVWTNEHALNEILANLVSNALKHAWPLATERVKQLSLLVDSREIDFIEIVVRDNGCGIDADDLPRIFDKGFRADAGRHSVPGDGLGLAIVSALVDKLPFHAVTVQSTLNRGTTFRLRLPATDPESVDQHSTSITGST